MANHSTLLLALLSCSMLALSLLSGQLARRYRVLELVAQTSLGLFIFVLSIVVWFVISPG